MLNRTLNLEMDQAYAKLKTILTQKGCKIVSEIPPNHLLARQGSLWGMSPATAKKTIDVALTPAELRTKAKCSSILSSDWKNLTIVGCALAVLLAGICMWMALDLNAAIESGKASFWSWLVFANGVVNVPVAKAFVNLTEDLAVFLSVIIILEVSIAVYAHKRIDSFAQRIFEVLASNEAVD